MGSEQPTDGAVVKRVLAGDVDAFRILVERYHPRAMAFAQRLLHNQQDAEDAVQDAFLKAYRALPRYEDRERFASWLLSIVANECRGVANQRTRHAAPDTLEEELLSIPAPQENSDAVWRDAVQHALDDLEPLLREAFLMRHVYDLSYVEMQAITGAGGSALKMRVKRACEALRGRLGHVRDS